MDSTNRPVPLPAAKAGGWMRFAALAAAVLMPMFFLGGCMTPEDRAFYGRGWINPSELDRDTPPPQSFRDPTRVPSHMMGPGEY